MGWIDRWWMDGWMEGGMLMGLKKWLGWAGFFTVKLPTNGSSWRRSSGLLFRSLLSTRWRRFSTHSNSEPMQLPAFFSILVRSAVPTTWIPNHPVFYDETQKPYRLPTAWGHQAYDRLLLSDPVPVPSAMYAAQDGRYFPVVVFKSEV